MLLVHACHCCQRRLSADSMGLAGAAGLLVRLVWARRGPSVQCPAHSGPPGSHAGGCAVPDEGTRGQHPSRRRHLVEPPAGRRQSPA
ncbi:unnamed protein product [Ixodes pacificus]